MRKIILYLCLCCICSAIYAQDQQQVTQITIPAETPGTSRVYAELVGYATSFFGLNKNVVVSVDLGQYQSFSKDYTIVDENGKSIKFNSMVGAMNYMGERGWKFVQAYIITGNSPHVHHWLLYKDIHDKAEIYEGLMISNTESAPEKPAKDKTSKDKSKQSN